MSRPTKYRPEVHLIWLRTLARRGYTLDQMAKELEISKTTLCKWMREDEKLMNAINENRSYVDAMVEDSLYNRAKGCKITEKKTIIYNAKSGNPETRIEITEKEIPPDTTAQIFWLKNRQPEKWRETQHVETNFEDLKPLAEMLKIDKDNGNTDD